MGDRLRKGTVTEDDLRLLDSYRRSFSEAYDYVVNQVRTQLGQKPTGRPAKSTTSVIEKLRRESMRLSQIQDIAGCRIVVQDIADQDGVVAQLKELFPTTEVVDRRRTPSHGYRAVHVIVTVGGKLMEIQVRTALQDLWAGLSERLSDLVDPGIKYGKGDTKAVSFLATTSQVIATAEREETRDERGTILSPDLARAVKQVLEEFLKADIASFRQRESKDVLPD